VPSDTDDNDIPSLDGFAEDAVTENDTDVNAEADAASLADLLAAPDGTLATFGRRAAEVLALGLDSLVQQKPDVRVLETGVAEYAAVVAELAESDHFAIEVRFALSDTEAYPIAALIPFDDLGSIFMVSMSAAEMADAAFAAGQVELVTQGARELLDLSGLMLFIDALAGGEVTVSTVRVREIEETVAVLQAGGQETSAARIALAMALPGGAETRLVLLVPGALLARLDALLSAQTAPMAPQTTDAVEPSTVASEEPAKYAQPVSMPPLPSAEAAAPVQRATDGDSADDDRPNNISPLRSVPYGSAEEPEVSIHPVRFPPLEIPDVSAVAQQQQQMDLILDVPLRVSVELGRSSMTVEAVLALGPGSVVELNKLAGEPVDVLVNDRLIARGEVVVVDENFGVRVTEVISPRSRANAITR
jgi:flagellar motor switch protein FliN